MHSLQPWQLVPLTRMDEYAMQAQDARTGSIIVAVAVLDVIRSSARTRNVESVIILMICKPSKTVSCVPIHSERPV